ncbi:MAG TPA: ABC transporter permease [Bacilli bacterium]|nr:ABC transporter permease [Bacilli bacterium]HOR17455.1 ABC transporter permease [Bacilli bacterium]HPL55197.1 ABC transporter permease [Bacilli bacterium]
MVKKILAKAYISIMLLFMYAPLIVLAIFSFTNTQNIGTWNGFSFELYHLMFKNKDIMESLYNTLMVAIVSSVVSTILGTLGAIGIFYSGRKVKKSMEAISQIPVLNAEIVTALSLTILFVFVGVEFNFITLLIGHVVLTVPFVVLSVTPKLKQMDPSIYEAALDLGATPNTALWKVIVPEIIPGVFSGFILAITLSLDDYIITAITRNNSFQTLSTYVYGATARKGALPPALRALSTIIFVVILIVLIIVNARTKNNNGIRKEQI